MVRKEEGEMLVVRVEMRHAHACQTLEMAFTRVPSLALSPSLSLLPTIQRRKVNE